MNRNIFIVALFAVSGIHCRSIFIPFESFAPYDEQSGQFNHLLKREKKQTENPSEFEQDSVADAFNFHPLFAERDKPLSKTPVLQASNVFVPGPILPAAANSLNEHQQNDFDNVHRHEQRPFEVQNSAIPSLFPDLPNPNDVMKKLRSMFDNSQFVGEKLLSNDPKSSLRTYSSEYPVQYNSKYERNYGSAYGAPQSIPQPQYEQSFVPISPNYEPPQYAPQQYAPPSSCGSNLLIGCRPQVQSVPCFSQQSYSPPVAYDIRPNPVEYIPRPSYRPNYNRPSYPSYPSSSPYNAPIKPDINPPNSPAYHSAPVHPPSLDVYSQPGPPYPEPILSSVHNPTEAQEQLEDEERTTTKLRQDSEPEPSNIEKKTDACETNRESITSAINPMTESTTSPIDGGTTLRSSTEDQIRRLHEKLDTHVENIQKFKEEAEKKLRFAIERSSISSSDDSDEINSVFGEPMRFAKRHINRDHIYNSVW